jgi:hypothetical protein
MQHAAVTVAEVALTLEAVGLLIASVCQLCCSSCWCLRCNAAGHIQHMAVAAVAAVAQDVKRGCCPMCLEKN